MSESLANTPRRWLLDAGNTRLKLVAPGAMDAVSAIDIGDDRLPALLRDRLAAAVAGDEAWYASVAPAAATQRVDAALREAGLVVHRVQSQARRGSLCIAYREPSRLGVDRFLGLLAASRRDDGPWLLVSAGSALTVDLLQADGLHVGGAIAPMPGTMRAALAARFAALDVAPGAAGDFADDTADAIASGCTQAAVGLVEHSLRRARQRLGVEPTLLITGGAAELLASVEAKRRCVVPTLVLQGLAVYATDGC